MWLKRFNTAFVLTSHIPSFRLILFKALNDPPREHAMSKTTSLNLKNKITVVLLAVALMPGQAFANNGNNTAIGVGLAALIGGLILGASSSQQSASPPPQAEEEEEAPPPVYRGPTLSERAEMGNADAQVKLATLYLERKGQKRYEQLAFKWFHKAADQGNATGQYNIAKLYSDGIGTAKDEKEATKWYRKAAIQGNPDAINLISEKAKKGDADAEVSMGLLYQGGMAEKQDDAEAVKWYRMAAWQGNADGQYSLGYMYENGKGVVRDYAEAFKWYKFSAMQGNDFAETSLAEMYIEGKGTPVDNVQAYKWLTLASVQNNPAAKAALPGVESSLTSSQIADAQKQAREFTAGQPLSKKEMESISRVDMVKGWARDYWPYAVSALFLVLLTFFITRQSTRAAFKAGTDRMGRSFSGFENPAPSEVINLDAVRREPFEKTFQEKPCLACHALIRAKAEMCPKCGTMQTIRPFKTGTEA
ncbi:MAG TPA: tetratricopeptide repeat protein [Alphaproteobacteria bacterium]|nr:tetratricopeptide repeat protein [Alphaproteobacteria bacterium]